jgi:regulator of MON1-CCZ1 complex
MVQVKTLCLAIIRTTILERRPITTVSKVIDVVLDSYSRLMKAGGPSGVRRIHEQNQQSSGQPVEGSHVVPQETSPATMFSPVVNPDQESGVVSRTVLSNSGVEHAMSRTVPNTPSDSDEITTESGTSEAISGHQTSDDVSKRQAVGGVSRPLSSSPSMQQVPHTASVAISPTELFQSVFALVEDEMMGDPGYLIAVSMEFLRRYFFSI